MLRFLVVMVALAINASAFAERFALQHTFVPSDAEDGDLFGAGVDLSGDRVVVRSRNDYASTDRMNQTHIFERSLAGVWEEVDIIRLSGTGFYRNQEVAIDGDGLVIGSSSEPEPTVGSIDLFNRDANGWSPSVVEQLPMPDRNGPIEAIREFFAFRNSQRVGYYVAADSGIAVVNAQTTFRFSQFSGAALIYERTASGGWRQLAALTNPAADDEAESIFGYSVATGDGVIAVGGITDPQSDDAPPLAIYEPGVDQPWELAAQFDGPVPENTFLRRVDLVAASADTVVAGTFFGAVSLFEKQANGEWIDSGSLDDLPVDPQFPNPAFVQILDPEFITSVAIEDETIAVGIQAGDDSHVRIYRRDDLGDWLLADAIPVAISQLGTGLKIDVALDGDNLLVGLPGGPNQPGTALLYTLVPEPTSAIMLATFIGCFSSMRSRPPA